MITIVSAHSEWNTKFAEACTAFADALGDGSPISELPEAGARFINARIQYDLSTKQQTLFAGALGDRVRRACLLANGGREIVLELFRGAWGDKVRKAHSQGDYVVFDASADPGRQRAISVLRFSATCFHRIAGWC